MNRPRSPALVVRLARAVRAEGWFDPEGDVVVIGLSGGVDSLTLLHLMRFDLPQADPAFPSLELHPAHLDHRMRAGSRNDADRLEAITTRWSLPLHREAASPPPASETEARAVRHDFLQRVRRRVGARWILLGHHADDQRETVLFRILRGTGIRGLAGMRPTTGSGLLRPLLEFSRAELEDHARALGLNPIEDPTNRQRHISRNRLRHEVLPILESVHPGAPESLLRLARRAREADEAMRALLAPHLERLLAPDFAEAAEEQPVVAQERGGLGVDPSAGDRGSAGSASGPLEISRDSLLAYPAPIRGEIVRALADRVGCRLSEAGTEATLEFIRSGSSGGRIELPQGVVLARTFDRLRLFRRRSEPDEVEESVAASSILELSGEKGASTIRLGTRRWQVRWTAPGAPERASDPAESGAGGPTAEAITSVHPRDFESPLKLRGRRPGDRVRGTGGSRKLKKLLGELRIPAELRDELLLLVDARGNVLWIPGYWRAPLALPGETSESWTIGVVDVRDST